MDIPEEHYLGWEILIAEYERGEKFDFSKTKTGRVRGFPKRK